MILEVALQYEGPEALGALEMLAFLVCQPEPHQLYLEDKSGVALVALKSVHSFRGCTGALTAASTRETYGSDGGMYDRSVHFRLWVTN